MVRSLGLAFGFWLGLGEVSPAGYGQDMGGTWAGHGRDMGGYGRDMDDTCLRVSRSGNDV
eukprot:1370538-Amorphochlora_amoeboformis.AAC.1